MVVVVVTMLSLGYEGGQDLSLKCMASNGEAAIVSVIVNRVFHNNFVPHWSRERELVSAQFSIVHSLCFDPVNTTERFTQLCTSHATEWCIIMRIHIILQKLSLPGAFCIYVLYS